MGAPCGVRLALTGALATIPSSAWAEANLVVTRADDAQQCPGAEEIRALSLAALPPSVPPPTHAYRVSFAQSGSLFEAVIVDETAQRTRVLSDTKPGCSALGQAVAVIVATMWSSERDETNPPPPPPSPSTGVDQALPVNPPHASGPRWVFGTGASTAVSVVRPVAPALLADVAVEFAHASLAVGALWIPAQRIDVAPGSIEVQLVSGLLRGCAFLGSEFHVGVCATALAGALHGEARGFTSDGQRTASWFAIEPDVFVDRSLGWWVRVRLAAGAVVPLPPADFAVSNAGAAYLGPAVGGLFSLSVEIASP
jgi:hypothetical protein